MISMGDYHCFESRRFDPPATAGGTDLVQHRLHRCLLFLTVSVVKNRQVEVIETRAVGNYFNLDDLPLLDPERERPG